MGAAPDPASWMEQILEASDLADLLPAANAWASESGCRASDLSEANAGALALFLRLKPIPSSRLIDTILRAINLGAYRNEVPTNPCLESKEEEPETDLDIPPPSPPSPLTAAAEPPALSPLAPGQRTRDQILCMAHGKWRGPRNVGIGDGGLDYCRDRFMCQNGGTDWRLHQTRSPPPRRKRRRSPIAPRSWSSEDISAHIAGLGRYPEESEDLRKAADGSFSLEALMSHWGHGAGLSIETVQRAIQDHLFKDIGGRGDPLLRFSVSQGPRRRDPIMIKVAHRGRT